MPSVFVPTSRLSVCLPLHTLARRHSSKVKSVPNRILTNRDVNVLERLKLKVRSYVFTWPCSLVAFKSVKNTIFSQLDYNSHISCPIFGSNPTYS